MNDINRVVVVDEAGRVYDRTGVGVDLSVQDNALTLKIFVKTPRAEE